MVNKIRENPSIKNSLFYLEDIRYLAYIINLVVQTFLKDLGLEYNANELYTKPNKETNKETIKDNIITTTIVLIPTVLSSKLLLYKYNNINPYLYYINL